MDTGVSRSTQIVATNRLATIWVLPAFGFQNPRYFPKRSLAAAAQRKSLFLFLEVRATALESASTVGKSRGGNARSLARVTNIIFYKLFLQTIIF